MYAEVDKERLVKYGRLEDGTRGEFVSAEHHFDETLALECLGLVLRCAREHVRVRNHGIRVLLSSAKV